MRNYQIYTQYARMICDFNFCQVTQKRVSEFCKLDPKKLFINQVIDDWSSTLESNIDKMREALVNAGGNEENIKAVDAIQKTFLFEGYKEHFENLIPRPNPETGLF